MNKKEKLKRWFMRIKAQQPVQAAPDSVDIFVRFPADFSAYYALERTDTSLSK